MEAVAAVCFLMAGSNVVILRHPETVRLTRAFIDLMINSGSASDIKEISKRLEAQEADLVSISPEPNLDFGKPEVAPKPKAAKPEKKAAPPKPEKKEEKPAPQPKKEKKVVEMKPKAEDEAATKAKARAEAKAEAEAKAKAEAKAEAEAKAKAEAEAKARAEAKAEAEAKAKAEVEAKAKAQAKSKEKEDLQALRYERALEREKHEAQMAAAEAEDIPKTAAARQLSLVEKLTQNLDRIHKRI
jgi:acetyl-CoA decarbonylase/synthase complex subunit delta